MCRPIKNFEKSLRKPLYASIIIGEKSENDRKLKKNDFEYWKLILDFFISLGYWIEFQNLGFETDIRSKNLEIRIRIWEYF